VSGGSFGRMSVHVGSDWRLWLTPRQDAAPILDIDAGTTSVCVSIRDATPGADVLAFARELLRTVQAFTAEVERLHATPATPASGDGGGAAGAAA
jgi:hypothetical protein